MVFEHRIEGNLRTGGTKFVGDKADASTGFGLVSFESCSVGDDLLFRLAVTDQIDPSGARLFPRSWRSVTNQMPHGQSHGDKALFTCISISPPVADTLY